MSWEVLTEWAGEDRLYAVLDLLSAIRCRVRRQVLGRRSEASLQTDPTDVDELARSVEAVVGEHLDERAAAATVHAVGVLGYSTNEVSALTDRTRRYVAKLRDRGHPWWRLEGPPAHLRGVGAERTRSTEGLGSGT